MAEAEAVPQQTLAATNGIDKAPAPKTSPKDFKTKLEYRRNVWETLERNRLSKFPRPVYGRIPNFIGSDEAAKRLQESDLFKRSQNIEVNPDKPQESTRIAVLESGKDLFVPVPHNTEGLLKHIQAPEGGNATALELKELINRKGIEENGKVVGLQDKVKLDLFVIGSVAVSKDGRRIGKGRGFVDLEYAVMVEMGAIGKDTVIATVVHDVQVFDTMPKEMFKPYDVPIDYIVTPTQVIKVEKPLERPTGVLWNLLSSRRVGLMPMLKALQELHISQGKEVTLKEEDTDVESYERRPMYRRNPRNRYPRGPRPRRDSAKADAETGAGDAATNQQKKRQGRSYFRRRLPPPSGQNAGETANGSAPAVTNGTADISRENSNRPAGKIRSFRKNRPKIDFSLEVRNIEKTVRVRDLKNALNEHGIKPNLITWRGYKGFCLLHYGKFRERATSSSEDQKQEKAVATATVSVDKVIDILKNMKIKPESERNLAVKIMEPAVANSSPISRIETTDVTSV